MNVLSETEIRRFKDQIDFPGIGEDGLFKIRNAKVAIIGAGSIGASALQYLSASGIGYFGIIDFSMVTETDIQQQTLYGGTDMGKLKTIISKQRLKDVFPLSQYEIINLQITSHNAASILGPFDIVVNATNNDLLLETLCKCGLLPEKPLVHTLVRGSKVGIMTKSSTGDDFKSPVWGENFSQIQSKISYAYGFAGLFAAIETVKIITGLPGLLLHKQVIFDCLSYSVTEL